MTVNELIQKLTDLGPGAGDLVVGTVSDESPEFFTVYDIVTYDVVGDRAPLIARPEWDVFRSSDYKDQKVVVIS